MNEDLENITPEGSSSPIFLDPSPRQVIEVDPGAIAPDPAVVLAEQEAAVLDLMNLGISEERARIIIGLPPA